MDYSLSVSIMGVTSRKTSIERIRTELDYPAYITYDFMRDGGWANGYKAWSLFDRSMSHHLVLEDDVKLCSNFIPTVLKVIEACPEAIISLCTWKSHASKYKKAIKSDTHWFKRQCGLSGQAVLMPVEWVLKMLLTMGKNYEKDTFFDKYISTWAYVTGNPIWCTVPALVEHLEPTTSVSGHQFSGRIAGEYFIGEQDPTSIDWKHNMDIAPYYKEQPWDDAAKKWKGKIRYE